VLVGIGVEGDVDRAGGAWGCVPAVSCVSDVFAGPTSVSDGWGE